MSRETVIHVGSLQEALQRARDDTVGAGDVQDWDRENVQVISAGCGNHGTFSNHAVPENSEVRAGFRGRLTNTNGEESFTVRYDADFYRDEEGNHVFNSVDNGGKGFHVNVSRGKWLNNAYVVERGSEEEYYQCAQHLTERVENDGAPAAAEFMLYTLSGG